MKLTQYDICVRMFLKAVILKLFKARALGEISIPHIDCDVYTCGPE